MNITFCGAAGTVTGSNYLVETESAKILIDCGLFQGSRELKERNNIDFIYDPKKIDAVLITHGHIDHIGLLPKLVKKGFSKTIYATKSTIEIMEILLNDTANIQKQDAEWENKMRTRTGDKPVEPLYDADDVYETMQLIKPIEYHVEFSPIKGIKAVYKDAGHILGSGFLELSITENNIDKNIVFSGDIGRANQSIIKDPETSKKADIVIIESTYGDRLHKTGEDTEKEIVEILSDVARTKGTLIIPAFALGRTQEMIYKFFELFDKHKIPEMKIYVDSPMASKITEIYSKNNDLYDKEMLDYVNSGKNPFSFSEIVFCSSRDDSMKLNDTPGPKVIISSSGMCDAGRIQHHLKHNLWKPTTHVLFVGFQGKETLGRKIIEGAKKVNILGDLIQVNAKIHTVGGLSAHADKNELIDWLKIFKPGNPKIMIVHGEPEVSKAFSESVKKELGFTTFIPEWKDNANIKFLTDKIEIDMNKTGTFYKPAEQIDRYRIWKETITKVDNLLIRIDKENPKDKELYKNMLLQKLSTSVTEILDES